MVVLKLKTTAYLLSRAMSSLTNSRTVVSNDTLTSVSPANPGRGNGTVMAPPSTVSLVVVIASARDENPRTAHARPRPTAGIGSLRRPEQGGTAVARMPLLGKSEQNRTAMFERTLLLLLCSSRRTKAEQFMAAAVDGALEHMQSTIDCCTHGSAVAGGGCVCQGCCWQ